VSAGTLLVVNAGSSSLKLRVLDADDRLLVRRDVSAQDDWEGALEQLLEEAPTVVAAGHRVVHGGNEFIGPALVDARLEERLEELEQLAPLHNPPAIRMVHALRRLRPRLPAVACFDTAFHRTLPRSASTYAVPSAWAERWGLRRFGFHGLSHAYASRRAAELLGRPLAALRLVTAHLGAGASLAAVAGGRSVDTTMGFTPLEGLVMATRSGSVDPGLLLWVQRRGALDAAAVERALEHESGLLGISKRSSSVSELLDAASAGDELSSLAIDVFLHRLRAGIGAMAAALGGVDALVFTGGVGEGSTQVRERTCLGLAFLGLSIDSRANEAAEGEDAELSAPGAPSRVLLVHAREDLQIAAGVRECLGSPSLSRARGR
jgi:acetate kinase